ncbi:MAG: signal peptidase II [Fidelibacterota bacterium]
MIVLLVTVFLVVLDQGTKYLIRNNLDLFESVPVIDGFFHLTYVTNDGMAFGINFPGGFYLFTVASIIMSIVLIIYLWTERRSHIMLRLSLALILSGALGNLIDRLWFRSVVDFLDFIFAGWHFYIFNIADSGVTVGMILFLFYSFIIEPRLKRSASH